MKTSFSALGGLAILLFLLISCTEILNGDSPKTPETVTFTPGYWTGNAGSQGTALFNLGEFELQVTATSGEGAILPGAAIEIFGGTTTALIWVESPGRVPAFHWLEASEIPPPETTSAITSKDQIIAAEPFALSLELPLQNGMSVGLDSDPENVWRLYSDESFESSCQQSTTSEMFAAVQSAGHPWLALRAYGAGSTAGENQSQNALLKVQGLTQSQFDEFAFSNFGYTDDDTLDYCFYNLNVNSTHFAMPQLHIDDFSEGAAAFAWRFILSWTELSYDLDAHLWTPEIEGHEFHVYFGNTGSEVSAPFSWLNFDTENSTRPEILTIGQQYPGTYTIAVTDYAGSGGISASGATLEIYRGRDLQLVLPVPEAATAEHQWWVVGTVDESVNGFQLINEIQQHSGFDGQSEPKEQGRAMLVKP